MSNDPVEHLFNRAEGHRIPMSDVCDRANVAQSTPSRWRTSKNGATYATIRKLNEALDALIAEKGAAHDGGASTANIGIPSSRKSTDDTPPFTRHIERAPMDRAL